MLRQDIQHLPVHLHLAAERHHFLHGAFADEHIQAVFVLNNNRHSPSVKVKGNFVNFLPFLLDFSVGLVMLQNCFVHQVFEPRLKIAVDVAEFQHSVTGIAARVNILFQDDFALGDGAGLIGAEHIHRAKILDRIQALDDYLLFGHGYGPLREICRDNHRQHLGGHPHRDRDREEESLQPIVLAQTIDEDHRGNHNHHKAQHQPGELVDALVEAGNLTRAGDAAGQRTKVGILPCVNDQRAAGAAFHVGAQEASIRQLQRVFTIGSRGQFPFFDRD